MYGLEPWSAEERLADLHAEEEWTRIATKEDERLRAQNERLDRIEAANCRALLEDDGLDHYDRADIRQREMEDDDRRNLEVYADRGVTY